MQQQILYEHEQHFNNVPLSALCRSLTRVVTKVQISCVFVIINGSKHVQTYG